MHRLWVFCGVLFVWGCEVEASHVGDDSSQDDIGGVQLDLARGQIKILNTCEDLSLYEYNPVDHGTDPNVNPSVTVPKGKKLIWQTLSGTPNGWATVLSAGQEDWGWRFCRVECLGGSW